MKRLLILFLPVICFQQIFGQNNLSAETRQFVTYNRGTYLLQNLSIVDGTGGGMLTDQDILIEGDMIRSVGKDLPAPANATILDMQGKSAMPGMVMLHEHLFYPKTTPDAGFGVDQMSYSFPRLYLAGGVTTMRTAGSIMPQADVHLRKAIDQGLVAGPSMDVTSPHMDKPGVNIIELLPFKSTEEAVRQVNYYADMGITSFKVYNFLTRQDLKAIVDAAHARGMKVTGHLCSITYREAADIGIDDIEHGFFSCSDLVKDKIPDECDPFAMRKAFIETPADAPVFSDLINYLVEKKVALTSTINVFEPYTGREIVPGGGLDALCQSAKEKVFKRWAGKQNKDSIDYLLFNKSKFLEKKFYDAGGLLVAGTDPTYDGRIVAGYANMRLLELFTEMGFTVPEAVKICTLNGARYLGLDQKTGTIASGKTADIIIMDGDITKDISAIRSGKIVFKKGIGYNSEKLFKAAEGWVGIR